MVNPIVAPFEGRPMGLYAVRVGHASDELGDAVLDALMGSGEALVGPGLVGVDHRVGVGVLPYEVLEGPGVRVLDHLG